METTLTKRTLSGAVVKASSVFESNQNSYKITTQIEKTGHNLLIGGTVNVKITGLDIYSNILSGDPIIDFFNQEKTFKVVDANIIKSEIYVKSKLYNNQNSLSDTLITIGGTALVQINNDKITLKSGAYNFELLNNVNYPNLRVWDAGYRFKLQEKGIGSAGVYSGVSDFYSDGTINELSDLNEKDLYFRYCEYVELLIIDATGNNIDNNDYTKTTNIGLIINEL
jgi:hypothetical protein